MKPLAGLRILVVEDDFIVAAMAEIFLADLGAVVVGPACKIREALALAEREALDATLLDVNMGGVRSDAIADVLVARNIPFVLTTGYGDAESARGVPVVDKPYTPDDLCAAIQLARHAHNRP